MSFELPSHNQSEPEREIDIEEGETNGAEKPPAKEELQRKMAERITAIENRQQGFEQRISHYYSALSKKQFASPNPEDHVFAMGSIWLVRNNALGLLRIPKLKETIQTYTNSAEQILGEGTEDVQIALDAAEPTIGEIEEYQDDLESYVEAVEQGQDYPIAFLTHLGKQRALDLFRDEQDSHEVKEGE